MRVVTSTLTSWLLVTTLMLVTLAIEGLPYPAFDQIEGYFAFAVFVAFVVAIYYLVVGGPIAYVLLREPNRLTRKNLLMGGVLASVPMLLLSIASQEIEWVLATVIAGLVGGGVFATMLPRKDT